MVFKLYFVRLAESVPRINAIFKLYSQLKDLIRFYGSLMKLLQLISKQYAKERTIIKN